MKFYDCSVTVSGELPVWPGDPGISMKLSSSLDRGDSANVTQLECGVHTGTHIDAPSHFEPKGASVDEIPLEILIGPCRVFDTTHVPDGISLDIVKGLDLESVTRALFKTTNSNYWRRAEKQFQEKFVHLTAEAARYLVERGLKLVGIDYLSIERFQSPDHATHHVLLRNNVAIIEGLNLSQVPAGDYELMALPLKLKGADGAPTRVVLRDLGS